MEYEEERSWLLLGLVVALLIFLFWLATRRDIGKARKAARKQRKKLEREAAKAAEAAAEAAEEVVETVADAKV